MSSDLTTFGVNKTVGDLVREDIERQAIEECAKKLETHSTNEFYSKAWKAAAKVLRAMKP